MVNICLEPKIRGQFGCQFGVGRWLCFVPVVVLFERIGQQIELELGWGCWWDWGDFD